MAGFHDQLLTDVMSDCFRAFSLPVKVKPLHINDLWKQKLDDWGSAPGMPWKHYGYQTKADVIRDPNALKSIKQFWQLVMDGQDVNLPYCLGIARPHRIYRNRKRRPAMWGYPCTASFMEACFALPLIDAYYETSTPMAFRFSSNRGACQELFRRFHDCNNVVSLNYKSFYQSIPDWLIKLAFDVLATNINWHEFQGHNGQHNERLYRVWRKLIDYFIRAPTRFRNGTRYDRGKKGKGIGGGSYFAELIYTIVNFIVTQYCIRDQNLDIEDHLVLGDESLVATSGTVDLSHLVARAGRFNMIINIEGVQITNHINGVRFLGYDINRGSLNAPPDIQCVEYYSQRYNQPRQIY
ncbi:uncharacterized protein LOC129790773 isoform X1 [Lutzomyia longipalpis]|uniref:uncharacterized protein LOC129790773 isoform X1 n=1 Tax=Lutzomyia longipalpis TaxID=7200 RepID=UPI0024834A47|nr:uncharacterized protein LOC129790773 isoform X1 [Lutzomyia longipalpis]